MSREPGYDARSGIRSAINAAVLRAARADGIEVRDRKPWRGALATAPVAEPLAGIRYAVMARDAASAAAGNYIRYARQDGRTWLQVGQALGLTADSGYDIAVTAYEFAAGTGDPFRMPSFFWDCPACGQGVTDHGPYTAHPLDNESGHADSCTRLAADLARYRADWEDE